MKIGWHADAHYSGSNKNDIIKDPINYLFETIGCDITIFGGDNTLLEDHVGEGSNYPNYFWNAVDETDYGHLCYAIPGNHDVPLDAWFRYSDDRAICPRELNYDGISIYLLNTVGSYGKGDGKPDNSGGRTGIGEMCSYVPMKDIRWFHTQATAAKARGDVILVFSHHHLFFTVDSAAKDSASGTSIIPGYSFYQIIRNAHSMYAVLQDIAPVICLMGHLYVNPSGEGYKEHDSDEVYLVYKDHFWTGAVGTISTFAYIEVNTGTGNVKVYTIEHNYSTVNTILNLTPSW